MKLHCIIVSFNCRFMSTTSTTTPILPTKSTKVYVSTTDNPLFNLATEDWLFNHFDLSQQVLFLWRNKPTVVIGRYQNPFKECHLQAMEKDGVVLARRYSGGGAVYQDHGNSIFTFLSATDDYDKKRNTGIIIDSLKPFIIQAEASGRNDVLVDGKKVSGSAFKQSGKRSFHHGTMLINIDANSLAKYLNPNKEKLKSKGITSVISRVCNLNTLSPTINHQTWSQSIINSFEKQYNLKADIEELNTKDLEIIPSLKETFNKLSAWDWRFGNSPPFEHQFEKRFDWGIMDVNINCSKGIIEKIKIYSDALNPIMIEVLQESLIGMEYGKDGITVGMDRAKNLMKGTDSEKEIEQLKQWLIDEI
ncbi:hypothetical protein DFA_11258 [Cavenderia fasciculata]|uniref:lipoate--protein ligase n=1 Tax=Cavenderia fasciculata TaxID=261658 RepID=F4QFP4_CACFS|nr:uncharacterized protein DFA_11258 [Cavenderia fasciculata]EGG13497.1 hypothetical protein DFA_11258 [Cavenderia fasciculata]|eukprot:XP_004350201.1 hypothetical protein DFA_11258 [Cavenderia fasciculata]